MTIHPRPAAAVFSLVSFLLATAVMAGDAATVTHKGWFSDEGCAKGRVESGNFGPNGRDCVQKCLRDGARMVFVDETAKAMYVVENPKVALGQESHYVEVAGTVDASNKTFHVGSVKVLKEYVASCAVPKKGE